MAKISNIFLNVASSDVALFNQNATAFLKYSAKFVHR